MKSLQFGTYIFLFLLPLLSGCHKKENVVEINNWSVSKYSEITGINYEETADGYKGAFYSTEDIVIDKIKNRINIQLEKTN